MPVNLAGRDLAARDQPLQYPVEAVFGRAARATRRTDHRLAADFGKQHQIAGIDRHAEMDDPPP